MTIKFYRYTFHFWPITGKSRQLPLLLFFVKETRVEATGKVLTDKQNKTALGFTLRSPRLPSHPLTHTLLHPLLYHPPPFKIVPHHLCKCQYCVCRLHSLAASEGIDCPLGARGRKTTYVCRCRPQWRRGQNTCCPFHSPSSLPMCTCCQEMAMCHF